MYLFVVDGFGIQQGNLIRTKHNINIPIHTCC